MNRRPRLFSSRRDVVRRNQQERIRPGRSVDSAISGNPEKTKQDGQLIRPADRILPGTD